MKLENLKIARTLYKPSDTVEKLCSKVMDWFDTPFPNGVKITDLTLARNTIILSSGNNIKSLKRVDNHIGIEVHFYPNYNISTTNDPFCSIFILKHYEIKKILKFLEKCYKQQTI